MSVRTVLFAAGFVFLNFSSRTARAQDVLAILSSDSPYYREALDGFKETFAEPVTVRKADEQIIGLAEAKVVVTFGKKATLLGYSDQSVLIYALTPGLWMERDKTINISMIPSARILLKEYRLIQPDLRKLAVLYVNSSFDQLLARLKDAAAKFGIEILPAKMPDAGDLPDRLRDLLGKADALFLLPDPDLINDQSLSTLKSFSMDNRIPYYAGTSALVKKGATAAVSINFKEIGRTAAATAQNVLLGSYPEPYVFPERYELTLNAKAAEDIGLRISPDVLNRANVVP